LIKTVLPSVCLANVSLVNTIEVRFVLVMLVVVAAETIVAARRSDTKRVQLVRAFIIEKGVKVMMTTINGSDSNGSLLIPLLMVVDRALKRKKLAMRKQKRVL
jgi:hypothetical protein